MSQNSFTILITLYNESQFIIKVLEEISSVMDNLKYEYKIVLVNDGSTDWSKDIENNIRNHKNTELHNLENNVGKGGAYNYIFSRLDTEYVIATDADLEYPAYEIPRVIEVLLKGKVDHCIGSRYGFNRPRPQQYWLTYLANKLLNFSFYIFSGVKFNDFLSGLFGTKTKYLKNMDLKEKRFGYVPEFYWRLVHQGVKFTEIPIDYRFRSYKQGKKIKWYEFFTHFRSIVVYKKNDKVATSMIT